jgi:hypothetical protein
MGDAPRDGVGPGIRPNRQWAHGAALTVLAALLAAPITARAADHARDRHAPDALHHVRRLHQLQLQVAGSDVRRDPVSELQQAHNDCALAIVARLYRDRAQLAPHREQLAALFDLGPRGVTLDRLASGMNTLGWNTTVQRTAPTATAPVTASSTAPRPPAIALLRPGHYVLLTHRTASHVEYFDPLVGQVRQPLPQFSARWTGKSVQLSTRDN